MIFPSVRLLIFLSVKPAIDSGMIPPVRAEVSKDPLSPTELRRLLSASCAPSGMIPKDPGFKSSPDGIFVALT